MDPAAELERIHALNGDRNRLSRMDSKYGDYVANILGAETKKDMQELGQELAPYFATVHRWNSDIAYYFMRTFIDKARKLKQAFDERAKELGLEGKLSIQSRERISPTLMALAKEYSLLGDAGAAEGKAIQPTKDTSPKIVQLSSFRKGEKPLEQRVDSPEPILESENPILTLLNYYKQRGVVGEEDTSILQTLGAINKLCFGIESLSGSGKSYTVKMLMELLPEDSVYVMDLSSKTAEVYNADTINKAQIVYIPELQKAMNSSNPIVVEILKRITEGEDAQRKVRDQATGTVKKYVIRGDKGVIFTLAVENAFKYDAEFSRRVFILHTDISPEQTDGILRYKASMRHAVNREQRVMPERDVKTLKEHIRNCLLFSDIRYENPFAEPISAHVPRTIRARSYDSYYFNLIEAAAKFQYQDRVRQDDTLFINLEDVYMIHQLYWKQFCRSLLMIPLMGEDVLALFNGNSDGNCQLTAHDVYKQLRNTNPSVSYLLVGDALESLVTAGFLDKDDHKAREPKYLGVESMPDLGQEPDWKEYWEQGKEFMQKNYPGVAERWIKEQTTDGKVKVLDAMKREYVELVNLG